MRNHVDCERSRRAAHPTSVEREIDLPVPAEEAWELLADAERLEEWLAPEVDLVPEPGTPLHVREDDGTERVGIVDDVVPGERLPSAGGRSTTPTASRPSSSASSRRSAARASS